MENIWLPRLGRAAVTITVTIGMLAAAPVQASTPTTGPSVSRPDADAGPTRVFVAIWVADIDRIDSANQNYAANIFVGLRWKDIRLAHGGAGPQAFDVARIWSPRILVANETGMVRKTLPDVAEVAPDGTVIVRQRYVGTFSQPLNLRDFPIDRHIVRFHLVSPGHKPEDFEFVPDDRMPHSGGSRFAHGAGIAENLSLPDWDVQWVRAGAMPYLSVPGMQAAGYALEFQARRRWGYFLWKILLPLTLITLMSWSVFWIDPAAAGPQIGVATTAMLTLIAYRFAVDQNVPKVAYLTRLDYLVIGSSVLVFLALCLVILTAMLAKRDRLPLARRLTVWSRIAFIALLAGLAIGSFAI